MGCLNDKQVSTTEQLVIQGSNVNTDKKNSIYIVPPSASIASQKIHKIEQNPENLFVDLNISDVFRFKQLQKYQNDGEKQKGLQSVIDIGQVSVKRNIKKIN